MNHIGMIPLYLSLSIHDTGSMAAAWMARMFSTSSNRGFSTCQNDGVPGAGLKSKAETPHILNHHLHYLQPVHLSLLVVHIFSRRLDLFIRTTTVLFLCCSVLGGCGPPPQAHPCGSDSELNQGWGQFPHGVSTSDGQSEQLPIHA